MSPPAPAERWRLADHPLVRNFLGGVLIGGYLRLIRMTSRVVCEPADYWQRFEANWPPVAMSWHGQSNLAYALMPRTENLALLISNHPDGQMAAAIARSFGYRTIEGSGSRERSAQASGGVAAFRAMLRSLKAGTMVFATADLPPGPALRVSPGMVALARRAGRPVFTVATASSRRRILTRTWDRMQFNYPFSTVAFVAEGPFLIDDPDRSDEAYCEDLRLALDRVLARAFAIVDGRG